MSTVSWITKSGSFGVIPESQYYSTILNAVDSDEQPLFYSFISGILPKGLYVTQTGELRGIPTLTSNFDQTSNFSFTIRATNPQGKLADRSFTISISNVTGPIILGKTNLVGAWFDGNFLDYQFTAVNDNPSATAVWNVVSGVLPPGTALSSNGRLSGFVEIIAANTTSLGYEASPVDYLVYDNLPLSTDRYYNFVVQATDGLKFDTYQVNLLIVSKGNYTADNQITIINNTFITIDADNKYRPIILNDPQSLPILVSGSTFAYRFIAFDPEYEDVSWKIDEAAFSGLDELDAAVTQNLIGNGTAGPYTLTQTPLNANRIVVRVSNILLTATVDYNTVGDQLTFLTLTPTSLDNIEVLFVDVNTGFDSILYDQGAAGLPSGLNININTGWIFGVLPPQIPDITNYSVRVTAYRRSNPTYQSNTVTFSLTTKRTLNEEIVWVTDESLGTIDNGSISELSVEAYNTLGKELEYTIVYQNYRKIPQGLKFLPSGRFTGRTTFRYFSLDGARATLHIASTQGLEVGMSVQGPGIFSGCKITAIIDSTSITVQPSVYVAQGTLLTFSNQSITKVVSTTANAVSTVIDGGGTSFDRLCQFTVQASATDGTITSLKTFKVTINPYNLAPYENIYLRALPSDLQRSLYSSIINDPTIFPPSLIYRPDDPNFGINQIFKILFLAGLTPIAAAELVNSMQYNHYDKVINFGSAKTAIAKDQHGNIVYEVVYVDAVDNEAFDTPGPPLEVNLNIQNNYLFSGESYHTIYPNSFANMQKRLENAIGYTNRGALPKWMTSVQESGLVLGPIRAVVLAYTVPGASKLIQYRFKTTAKLTNNGNFSFISDRYQWDNSLSTFYNTTTASFEPSKETTFDKYTNKLNTGDIIDTFTANAATNSTTVQIPDNIVLGQGWVLVNRDDSSQIPNGTIITSISGNLITLSDNITTASQAAIRIIGETKVDYAVNTSFASINNTLLSQLRNSLFIDGVVNFVENELIVFRAQIFPGEDYNGWYYPDGTVIPGYLDKISGTSPVNRQGGAWKLTWQEFPEVGFDSLELGFDQESPGITNSYFDQGNDSEVTLVFVNEVLLNQRVGIRSGKTYPKSILNYTATSNEVIPRYVPVNTTVRTAETTFDGGTCCVREKDIAGGRQGVRGGLGFFTNRDKYIKPESKDKYIKFPQNGVFV
jgi:hypothetical protein